MCHSSTHAPYFHKYECAIYKDQPYRKRKHSVFTSNRTRLLFEIISVDLKHSGSLKQTHNSLYDRGDYIILR